MPRMTMSYTLFVLSYLLWTVSAMDYLKLSRASTSTSLAAAPADVLPPSKDPFYTEPKGYEFAAPGTVLRTREAPGLAKLVANSSAAYNILYRTTNSNYKPAWAVTTLFVPQKQSTYPTAFAANSTLLSYQSAYDSANVDSSPSYTLYTTATDPTLSLLLGQGVYLTIPDYEGPSASFTAGVQSGHATIDAVRAALSPRFGLRPNTRYALWGYSGGALASEWAAELAVQYAPEMRFAGVALGGLTPNVTSVVESVNKGGEADLVINGMLGLTSQDFFAREFLLGELKETGEFNKTGFLAALHQNSSVDSKVYAGQDVFGYFESGEGILRNYLIRALINRDGIMGVHGVPQMPVFAYKAVHDEVSVVADTDALVERYCTVGANILYQRNTVGGHIAEYINGEVRVLAWLRSVLDGTYPGKYKSIGCTIQDVTVNITSIPI